MSQPAIEPATGVDENKAAENVADDADKHTPNTDPVAPPAQTTTDPSDGKESKDDLREIVTGLAEQVSTLTNLVQNIGNPDKPAGDKLPWALRGKRDL